jgi:hypothetical protein
LEKINDGVEKVTPGKMKELDILIAIKPDINSEENNNYYLASAKEIYINDDKVYRQAFNPLIAPEKLEPLYKVCVLKFPKSNKGLFHIRFFFFFFRN